MNRRHLVNAVIVLAALSLAVFAAVAYASSLSDDYETKSTIHEICCVLPQVAKGEWSEKDHSDLMALIEAEVAKDCEIRIVGGTLLDRWGNEIEYGWRISGGKCVRAFCFSCGPDGIAGSDDDIMSVWKAD